MRILAGLVTVIVAIVVLVVSPPAAAQAPWSIWTLGEARFETPPGWSLTDRTGETDLVFTDAAGRRLSFSWWKPDQPLTSFSDVVSHKPIRLAGEPALLIFARTGANESIQVATDGARGDGKQFMVIYTARGEQLGRGSLLVDDILRRVGFGPAVEEPRPGPAVGAAPVVSPPPAGGSAGRPVDPMLATAFEAPCRAFDAATTRPDLATALSRQKVGRIEWTWTCGPRLVVGILTIYGPSAVKTSTFEPLILGALSVHDGPVSFVDEGHRTIIDVEATSDDVIETGTRPLPAPGQPSRPPPRSVAAGGSPAVSGPPVTSAPVTAAPVASDPIDPPKALTGGGPKPVESKPSPPAMAADDPALPLAEGGEQTVVLVRGERIHPLFVHHLAHGGDWNRDARVGPDGLVVDGPGGDRPAIVGLHSEEAVVWLDHFVGQAETSIVFRFDPARTTGFVVGVSNAYNLLGNDPNNPRLVLHWRAKRDGTGAVRILRDYDTLVDRAAAPRAPAEVRLVLRPDGARFVLDGEASDPIPWPQLADGDGFRIYVYSAPDEPGLPAKMALTSLELKRRAGTSASASASKTDADPLPVKELFGGRPNDSWSPAAEPGIDIAQVGRFEGGAFVADVPEVPGRWARAGLLSQAPALDFDGRIEATSHRLQIDVDPKQTTGFVAAFNWGKRAAMWDNDMAAAVVVVRAGDGPFAGRWVLQLRAGSGPYAVWTRPLDAAWFETRWNGRVVLENGSRSMSVRLDGGPTLHASGFNIGRGAKLYMTAYSAPPKEGAPARLVLRRITSQWVLPAGSTPADRWPFVDDERFDPQGFLGDLAKETNAAGKRAEGGRP